MPQLNPLSYNGDVERPDSLNVSLDQVSSSPRVTRRAGPRRDVREADKMPPSLYKNLTSSSWQER